MVDSGNHDSMKSLTKFLKPEKTLAHVIIPKSTSLGLSDH